MMRLSGTKFGDIELDDGKVIVFPRGLIGFPHATRYVLLDPQGRAKVAWLQSLDEPALAFPVIDGATVPGSYPEPSAAKLAHDVGLGTNELATLIVVAVRKGKGLVANLLAPLVIDLESSTGAQVVLDPRKYSATVPLGAGEVPMMADSSGNHARRPLNA